MRLKRTLMVAATVAALVGTASPAVAAPPITGTDTERLPGTSEVGSAGFCEFPVLIEIVSHQKVQGSEGPDGSEVLHITGYSAAVVTNLDSGEKLSYSISGPGTLVLYPDGSFTIDASGQNLLWTTVANSAEGVPQIAYTNGHVQVSVDATGYTSRYELTGTSTDVCDILS
jgi:hypothetical protein